MNVSSIKTPGVYINEIDAFPPSIAQVATAIPAFIGYTEKGTPNQPTRIKSLLEFEQIFGGAPEPASLTIDVSTGTYNAEESKFKLYNSLRLFYANGGGACYIVSVGGYKKVGGSINDIVVSDFYDSTDNKKGIETLRKFDEPTLLLFPDAIDLDAINLGELQKQALKQCADLQDRFVIMDVIDSDDKDDFKNFYDGLGNQNLKYGAAYFPYLNSSFPNAYRFKDIQAAYDLKQLYPGDNDLKDGIDAMVALNADVEAIQSDFGATSYNKFIYLKWDDTIDVKANTDAITKNCWDLLSLFNDLDFNDKAISEAKFKTFIETDIVSLKLRPYLQKIFDFIKEYNSLMDEEGKELDDIDFSFPDLSDPFNSLITSNPNAYDKKLSNYISATTTVGAYDQVDYTKVQFELYKLHNEIVSAIESSINAIETYELYEENNLISNMPMYQNIVAKLDESMNTLPPSGAIAGIYAQTDATRGVWKAPANVSINGINGLSVDIDDTDQQDMNMPTHGKAINAIRKFTNQGFLVWGARTLDGNSNDWRYVNVRRLANMIEESAKKACQRYVFEPNVAQTWINVKGMIENYLTTLWNDGALAGAKPEHAFFVSIGLNLTMTPQDINEGRMIVKIGYAPVRPAEFIILEFKQQLQQS